MHEEFKKTFAESTEISGKRRELCRLGYAFQNQALEILGQGPKTVPELAEALGKPADEVTWWLMGYWRYGQVVEVGEQEDGYSKYKLVERN